MTIPNFHVVDDRVLRGGRPETPADYDWLASQEVGTIVNLEGDHAEAAEMLEAGASKFIFVQAPISVFEVNVAGIPWQILSNIEKTIRLAAPKVFVHCRFGKDRTGLVITGHRVGTGMNEEDAYQEALNYGYDKTFNFGLNKLMDRIRKGDIP